MSFAAIPEARAQDTATLPTQNVSITLSDAPVRTALDGLFKSTSLNYTIDPNVQENVTVTLHNVPFEVALKTILRSSTPELRYSVSDGVYKIYAPAADQANQSAATAGTPQTGYPGATGTTGGGPNIGYGPGANTGLNASTTDTKQLVLIKLTYAPGQLLNAVIGPVQIIAAATLHSWSRDIYRKRIIRRQRRPWGRPFRRRHQRRRCQQRRSRRRLRSTNSTVVKPAATIERRQASLRQLFKLFAIHNNAVLPPAS